MFPGPSPQTAKFDTGFFPQHLALLSVGENVMPMGYWTVISKNPFRFLICMQVGNYSLTLLRKYKEAGFHFLPWSERERIVGAGHLTGQKINKAETLGFTVKEAEKLQHTRLVEGAERTYELVVNRELLRLSTEFALFVMDVIAVHGDADHTRNQPILYLSLDDFATLGERWVFEK